MKSHAAEQVEAVPELIAAAERSGVTLGVVSQHRFRPTPRAAKRLIDAGVIGEVRMAQVKGVMAPWDMPRANLPWADLGAHLCDILRWLVGSEAELVAAQFHDFGTGDPPKQTAFVIVRFQAGALAHIWFSYEITEPGLYVLETNIVVADPNTNGIEVETNDVTIDLGGFTISGPGGAGTGTGITGDGRANVRVLNGTVRGMPGVGTSSHCACSGVIDIDNKANNASCRFIRPPRYL